MSNKSQRARGRADAAKGDCNPPPSGYIYHSKETAERRAEKRAAYREGYRDKKNGR